MKLVAQVLSTGKGRAVAVVLLLAIGWQVWLRLAAPAKVAPALLSAPTERVEVLVTLPFAPERFHVLAFQRWGRVSGTQDNTVELRGVNKADLLSVARPYWVTKVEPLPTE